MVDKITSPITSIELINKTNEIIDNLGSSSSVSYTATCPAITPVDGVATWVVTHNLGTQAVVTALYSNGNKVEHNTLVTSNNAITVTFKASGAVTAGSYKIVVLASGGSSGGSADDTYTNSTTNVEIVGSLVNNNGVLSGFALNNYAVMPNIFNPTTTWEMVIKINSADYSNAETILAPYQSAYVGVFIRCYSKIYASFGTTESTSEWGIGEIVGNTSLVNNQSYYIKVEFTGTAYNLYISTDGINFNLENTLTSSKQVSSNKRQGVGLNVWGASAGQTTAPFNGTIDLTETYINIGSSRWWTGAENIELTNLSPVTDYYVNGSSWYKETFSDATRTKRIWLEQGGINKNNGTGARTQSLIKPFTNANYGVQVSYNADDTDISDAAILVYNKTSSSFILKSWSSDSLCWRACGV